VFFYFYTQKVPVFHFNFCKIVLDFNQQKSTMQIFEKKLLLWFAKKNRETGRKNS